MGATTFQTVYHGESARMAFIYAREEALRVHGSNGYTGTIAEKDDFVMVECPVGVKPEEMVDSVLRDDDHKVSDKWGPAGCIALGEHKFLFFGWAPE
jgi:hypothetical protein